MWGARTQERKNSRNSITKVVSLSISKVIPVLVLEIQEEDQGWYWEVLEIQEEDQGWYWELPWNV